MWQSKYFHKETLTSSWLNATICLSQSDVPLEYHKPWNEPRLFSYLGRESIASRGILHGHKSKQRPREKLRVSPRSRKRPPNGSGVALHEATLIRGRGLPSPSLAPIPGLVGASGNWNCSGPLDAAGHHSRTGGHSRQHPPRAAPTAVLWEQQWPGGTCGTTVLEGAAIQLHQHPKQKCCRKHFGILVDFEDFFFFFSEGSVVITHCFHSPSTILIIKDLLWH